MLSWHADWAWSLPLIVANVVIHVVGLGMINGRFVEVVAGGALNRHHYAASFVVLIGMAALVTILHAFEATVWAAAYRLLGALPDNRSAMLYSLSAITSYGHAPVFLELRLANDGSPGGAQRNDAIRTDYRLSVQDDPAGLAPGSWIHGRAMDRPGLMV